MASGCASLVARDSPLKRRIAKWVCRGLMLAPMLLAASASGQLIYLSFGDSITSGTGDGTERGGYPPRLEDLLNQAGENVEVQNHGQPGEFTNEGVTRIEEVLAMGGDVLLLMEGTNDIARGLSEETTLFNLGEMARKAEDLGMEVVIASLIPRIPEARIDPENILNQRLVEGIRDLAGVSMRDLVDPFEEWQTIEDLFDRFYAEIEEDPVGHPNAAGYDSMASTYFDVLTGTDSVPPVTGVTLPKTGRTEVPAGATIRMDVWDFGEGIDVAATELFINGETVAADVGGNPSRVRIEWTLDAAQRGRIDIGLRSRDLASPANVVDRVVATFDVELEELVGDIDDSGRVDGVDLVLFARSFGAEVGEVRYLEEADFDSDGTIDGEDLAVLASGFGTSLS